MTETNRDRLVWVEIPATNLNRAKGFYEAVLQTALVENNDGPQTMQMIPCADGEMCGHLYEGKPATAGDGVTVHLPPPENWPTRWSGSKPVAAK